MELISIIMPAYNSEKFISSSISSVINQTYTNWELIIVNDGSIDNTKGIAENYSDKDSRIKVINQDNKKLGAARNTGIKNSKGIWIAFLDSDDLWETNKLEMQIAISQKYPTASVIYTDGWIFKNDDLKNLTPYPTITGKLIEHKQMYKLEYGANYIPVLSAIVRKLLIDQIGFQDERKAFLGCEDWDYWLRMARVGANFYGISQKLFYYRRHGSNMSGNTVNMLMAQVSVLMKNFDSRYIGKSEALVLLKGSFFPLIKGLIIEKRFDEIKFILNELEKILPSVSFKIIKGFIKVFGRCSLIPVIVMWKLERFIFKRPFKFLPQNLKIFYACKFLFGYLINA